MKSTLRCPICKAAMTPVGHWAWRCPVHNKYNGTWLRGFWAGYAAARSEPINEVKPEPRVRRYDHNGRRLAPVP